MANSKYPHVSLDKETYERIKTNGEKSDRSIAGEIRHMLAIVSQPYQGKERFIGMADVTKREGVTTIDDATETNPVIIEKHGIASNRIITHEPAHMPVEVFPANYGDVKGTFADTSNQFQPVEEKEG